MAAAQLFLCRKRALAALCLGLLLGEDEERPQKQIRKVYMRQSISRKEERGVFPQLIRELEVGNVVGYKEFFSYDEGGVPKSTIALEVFVEGKFLTL